MHTCPARHPAEAVKFPPGLGRLAGRAPRFVALIAGHPARPDPSQSPKAGSQVIAAPVMAGAGSGAGGTGPGRPEVGAFPRGQPSPTGSLFSRFTRTRPSAGARRKLAADRRPPATSPGAGRCDLAASRLHHRPADGLGRRQGWAPRRRLPFGARLHVRAGGVVRVEFDQNNRVEHPTILGARLRECRRSSGVESGCPSGKSAGLVLRLWRARRPGGRRHRHPHCDSSTRGTTRS